VDGVTVSEAAHETGWSPRMLRYLERVGLVVPHRTEKGYRLYRRRELDLLKSLRELRDGHHVGLNDVVFAARLYREPELRSAVDTWLAGITGGEWMEWDQRKHERLLAA
jgi:MerR family transcriptional regulator, copper efflux regulator